MRISLALSALLLLGIVSMAQEPSWTTKSYHVVYDGNELYSDCQSAEKNVRIAGKQIETRNDAGKDLFTAGICWGYVTAVVDSIPTGEGFEPDPDVKNSQEIDVVLAYLRDHPERRHMSAYFLARYALTAAFPAKTSPKR